MRHEPFILDFISLQVPQDHGYHLGFALIIHHKYLILGCTQLNGIELEGCTVNTTLEDRVSFCFSRNFLDVYS